LWNIPLKHQKYAIDCCEAHLWLVRFYEGRLLNGGEAHDAMELLSAIRNAYAMSKVAGEVGKSVAPDVLCQTDFTNKVKGLTPVSCRL